ncbi:MAG: class D sortase [Clostridiales bacterium]|nr:class D sortase [Clostridiales bacterium]
MKWSKFILCGILIMGAVVVAVPFFYQIYGRIRTNQLISEFEIHMSQEQSDIRDPPIHSDKREEEEVLADEISDFPEGAIGIIQIESIAITYPIMEGEGKAQLSHAVGHLSDTVGIGEQGNCVLAGHRGSRYGPIFKHLDQVKTGDEVMVTDSEGTVHSYRVKETFVTAPDDISVKRQDGKEALTLVTCEYKGTMRLIIRCVPDWKVH